MSGRQALVSAASALRDELGTIKDRLDLFVRGGNAHAGELGKLLAPLKQIGSTLSLLGFESSRSIVLDQVDALTSLVEGGQAEEAAILNVAGALVQVDENLASLTHSGKGEVEQITDEAQRAVAQQTRDGLDRVKQSIVDYVSSQWDVRHLQQTPAELSAIIGALNMIPLAQAAGLVQRCQDYLRLELMAGHVPSWEELDRLADALSGIDYYLERLSSDNPGGAEDVLEVVQRSLSGLTSSAGRAASPGEGEAPRAGEAAAQGPAHGPAASEDQPPSGGAEHVETEEIELTQVTTGGSGSGGEEWEIELEAPPDADDAESGEDEASASVDPASQPRGATGSVDEKTPPETAPAAPPGLVHLLRGRTGTGIGVPTRCGGTTGGGPLPTARRR